jgi:hypothetical protein
MPEDALPQAPLTGYVLGIVCNLLLYQPARSAEKASDIILLLFFAFALFAFL